VQQYRHVESLLQFLIKQLR